MRSLMLLVAIMSSSEWAMAQSRSRPHPADATAPVPPPGYQSSFSDYRPFKDEEVRLWKEVNKEVSDNPGTGSMHHKPGATTPGTDSRMRDHKEKDHDKKH